MTQISPKLFERLTELKGWHPYIKSTKLYFGSKARAKYELAFKENNFTTEMLMARARILLDKSI